MRLISPKSALSALALLFVLVAGRAGAQAAPAYVFGSPLLPLIVQMPENTWLKVNANRYDSVWTPLDLEPLGPDGAPHPASRIILPWSGFAWDSNRGDVILYGGGHANYSGNDVYRWHSSTLQWERASYPSEIKLDPVAGNIAIDGVDNAPIAAHTYDNNVFLPLADRFLTWGGASYNPDGGPYRRVSETNPSTWRITGPYLFDPNRANGNEVGGTTGSHVQRVAPYPGIIGGQMWQNRDVPKWLAGSAMPGSDVNGCTAATIEGSRDVMYIAATNGIGSGKNLFRYQLTSLANPSLDQIAMVGAFAVGPDGQTTCGFDPARKLFVRTGTNALPFSFWDLSSPGPANYDQTIQIDSTIAGFQSWLNAQGLDIQNCAIKFDPGRGTFLVWCGASTLWELHEPAGGNSSGGWTIAMLTAPSGPPGNYGSGILGKWRYAPYFDVFVGLEDAYEGQIWIYKPAHWQRPNVAGNALPAVAIVSPTNNATVPPGTALTVTASASDPDGTVTRVEYYVDGAKLGQATSPPYALPWTPLLNGTYEITAVAVDNDGGMTASSVVTLNVAAPLTTAVMQRGAAGNPGVSDTYLYSLASTMPQGASDLLYLDGSTARPLVRFAIFQSEGGSVPDGAIIQSAELSLYKQYYTSEVELDPVLRPWTEAAATWLATGTGASWSAGGASASGADIAASPDAVVSGDFNPGWMTFDVTDRVRQWSANAASNEGWRLSLTTSGANPLQFHASEYADATLRPMLTVVYAPPLGSPPPPAGTSINVALAANGGVATASSTLRVANEAQYVNDGQRSGAGWSTGGGGWADATPGVFPDWVQIAFSGQQTIDHVVVYSVQDDFQDPVEPTDTTRFTLYGLTSFQVQGWNGASWVTLGSVSGNDLVKRTVSFTPFTTDRVRIVTTGVADNAWSRIAEIEAWTATSATTTANYALAANGGVAIASSTLRPANVVQYVNDGQRSGAGWSTGGGGWADATPGVFPDWVEVDLPAAKTLDHVVVYSVQDDFAQPSEPTDAMTFSLYGLTAFDVQGWSGTSWVTLGRVIGNDLVKRTVSFAPYTTARIRIVVNGVADGQWSRITEIEAWGH